MRTSLDSLGLFVIAEMESSIPRNLRELLTRFLLWLSVLRELSRIHEEMPSTAPITQHSGKRVLASVDLHKGSTLDYLNRLVAANRTDDRRTTVEGSLGLT